MLEAVYAVNLNGFAGENGRLLRKSRSTNANQEIARGTVHMMMFLYEMSGLSCVTYVFAWVWLRPPGPIRLAHKGSVGFRVDQAGLSTLLLAQTTSRREPRVIAT